MAEASKASFPYMPERNWWTLRKRFLQRTPASVDTNYVSTVLNNMAAASARTNVIGPMKAVGLIDDSGKPTELASRWRDDNQYPSVCEEIRKKVYPTGLLDAFPEPNPNPQDVQNWFARHTKLGVEAAKKMARFYVLLSEADPNKESKAKAPSKSAASPKKRSTPKTTSSTSTTWQEPEPAPVEVPISGPSKLLSQNNDAGLSLHVDVQIHISSDASLDQIDQIFASMAKHLPFGRQERE